MSPGVTMNPLGRTGVPGRRGLERSHEKCAVRHFGDVTMKMISKDDYQVEVVIQQVLNEIIQGQPKKLESSNILIIRLVYPKRLICLVRSSCQLYLLYF